MRLKPLDQTEPLVLVQGWAFGDRQVIVYNRWPRGFAIPVLRRGGPERRGGQLARRQVSGEPAGRWNPRELGPACLAALLSVPVCCQHVWVTNTHGNTCLDLRPPTDERTLGSVMVA